MLQFIVMILEIIFCMASSRGVLGKQLNGICTYKGLVFTIQRLEQVMFNFSVLAASYHKTTIEIVLYSSGSCTPDKDPFEIFPLTHHFWFTLYSQIIPFYSSSTCTVLTLQIARPIFLDNIYSINQSKVIKLSSNQLKALKAYKQEKKQTLIRNLVYQQEKIVRRR